LKKDYFVPFGFNSRLPIRRRIATLTIRFDCAVSSAVEHYLDTIKRPTLAIFSGFLFPFAIIAEQLISLVDFNV
jgi:hypothetical protein